MIQLTNKQKNLAGLSNYSKLKPEAATQQFGKQIHTSSFLYFLSVLAFWVFFLSCLLGIEFFIPIKNSNAPKSAVFCHQKVTTNMSSSHSHTNETSIQKDSK